jgi:hypothetical protein
MVLEIDGGRVPSDRAVVEELQVFGSQEHLNTAGEQATSS